MYLEKEAYDVIWATDGEQGLQMALRDAPDLVVLDIMLPGLDGWEVCRRIRRERDVPIVMLTARSDDVDKVVGLEMGADDYVVKPFNPRELVARVRAVLRRYQTEMRTPDVLEAGSLRIEVGSREVTVNGQPISLRAKEFDLLLTFVRDLGMVLSRDQLLEKVWGYDFYGDTRTVDVHVSHLREKLAGSGCTIETLRGVGYKLVEG
jgi:DNA-binding response OmpR family regulator